MENVITLTHVLEYACGRKETSYSIHTSQKERKKKKKKEVVELNQIRIQ